MRTIKELIGQKNWDLLISDYSVKEICLNLDFSEAMHLVANLFYDDILNDARQQFALRLAFEIKDYFKSEWEADWKNEVFLGHLCEMLWLYDERYLCYKRAYDRLTDPPVALLLLLSGCNSAPGTPPITDEESEFFLRSALEKKVTYGVALKMKNLCERKGDNSQAQYWSQMSKKLEEKEVYSEELLPDVLNERDSTN